MVRVVHHPFFRGGDADEFEHLGGGVPGVFFRELLVDPEDFGNLAADAVHRIERGHRLLENHADFRAADFADFLVAGPHEVMAAEIDMAAEDFSRGLGEQADNRHRGDAFPAARLADDADGFAGGHRERHLIDGAQQAAVGLEGSDQLVHFEDVFRFGNHGSAVDVVGFTR